MSGQRTDESDINEIYCAYLLNDKKWNNLETEKTIYENKKQKVKEDIVALKENQARSMAIAIVNWAHRNGYGGKITNVYWTARPNFTFTSINSDWEEKSKDHPADILIEYSRSDFSGGLNGNFLGVSLKTIRTTSGEPSVKNPGTKKISKFINGDEKIFSNIVEGYVGKASLQTGIKKNRKYLDEKEVKTVLKSNSKNNSKNKTTIETLKDECLSKCVDTLKDKLESKDDGEVRLYILMDLLDTDKIPKYIKVISRGTTTINSTVEVPTGQNNSKFKSLMDDTKILTYEKTTGNKGHSLVIKCGQEKIIRIRFKFESTALATSLKMSIDPVSGIDSGIEKD